MEKDKQVIVSEQSKALERINVQFGLMQKVLKEDDYTCPLTINWWNSLPEQWQAIFSFFVKFQSPPTEKYISMGSFETIEAWYNPDSRGWEIFKEVYPNISRDLPVGRPEINKEFMEELFLLEKITLVDSDIQDISHLAHFKNLKTLNLAINYIEDIEPLRGLLNLKTLVIGSHCITNIDVLATLINLENLDISLGEIKSFNFLATLKKLIKLDVCSCEIENFNVPTTLTQLQEINLFENNIVDLGGLVGLISLKKLDLSINRIYDVTPLSELSNLESRDFNLFSR